MVKINSIFDLQSPNADRRLLAINCRLIFAVSCAKGLYRLSGNKDQNENYCKKNACRKTAGIFLLKPI